MIDAKLFWQAIDARPTAVPIVTAYEVGGPAGFLALSAAHVAAELPTVLVSIDDKTSRPRGHAVDKHRAGLRLNLVFSS